MKKVIVPKTVKRKVRTSIILRFARLILSLGISYVILDYFYEGLKEAELGNASTVVFVLLVVPFWACGVPAKLIDRSYYGEIIKIELENINMLDKVEKYDHNRSGVRVKALVRASDGKLYEHEVFDEGEYFWGERTRVYEVGDKVIHAYGTKYLAPQRTPAKPKSLACVWCGTKSPYETKVCRDCGCSLEFEIINIKK